MIKLRKQSSEYLRFSAAISTPSADFEDLGAPHCLTRLRRLTSCHIWPLISIVKHN